MTEMNLEERLGRLEVGLEALNQKVEGINRNMDNLRSELISGFDGMDAKIDNLGHGINSRIDNLGHDMDARFDRLIRNVLIAGIVIFPPLLATLGAAIASIFLGS